MIPTFSVHLVKLFAPKALATVSPVTNVSRDLIIIAFGLTIALVKGKFEESYD